MQEAEERARKLEESREQSRQKQKEWDNQEELCRARARAARVGHEERLQESWESWESQEGLEEDRGQEGRETIRGQQEVLESQGGPQGSIEARETIGGLQKGLQEGQETIRSLQKGL